MHIFNNMTAAIKFAVKSFFMDLAVINMACTYGIPCAVSGKIHIGFKRNLSAGIIIVSIAKRRKKNVADNRYILVYYS